LLIGAAGGAVAGALTECLGGKDKQCGEGVIMLGLLGTGAGALVGWLIQSTTIVYPESEKRITVLPAISRDAIGVRASLRW
jgi:hypothetical protein